MAAVAGPRAEDVVLETIKEYNEWQARMKEIEAEMVGCRRWRLEKHDNENMDKDDRRLKGMTIYPLWSQDQTKAVTLVT